MAPDGTTFGHFPEQPNRMQSQSSYNTMPRNLGHTFQAIKQENDRGNPRVVSGPMVKSVLPETHGIACVSNMSSSPMVMHAPRHIPAIVHASPMIPPGILSAPKMGHHGWVTQFQPPHILDASTATMAPLPQDGHAVQPQIQNVASCLDGTQYRQPPTSDNSSLPRRMSNPRAQVLAKGVPLGFIESGQFMTRMSQFGKIDKMNILPAKDGHESLFVFITYVL